MRKITETVITEILDIPFCLNCENNCLTSLGNKHGTIYKCIKKKKVNSNSICSHSKKWVKILEKQYKSKNKKHLFSFKAFILVCMSVLS